MSDFDTAARDPPLDPGSSCSTCWRAARHRRLSGTDQPDPGASASAAPTSSPSTADTADSDDPDAARQPRLGRDSAPASSSRSRSRSTASARERCYSPASRRGPRPRARDHRQAPPRRAGLQLPRRAAPRPGMVLGLSQPDGDFHLPDPRPDAILLIGGGSGITPLMAMLRTPLRRGTPRADHAPPLRPRPRARDLPRRARAARRRAPEPSAAPLLHPRPGRRRARRPLQPRPPPADRPRLRRGRDLRLRPARPCSTPCAATGRPTASSSGSTSRASCRPSLAPRRRARRGHDPLRRLRRRGPRTAAPRCSSRPRQAGAPPQSGCRMGICHTCSCRKMSGTVKNLSPTRSPRAPDEEIQLCIIGPARRPRRRPLNEHFQHERHSEPMQRQADKLRPTSPRSSSTASARSSTRSASASSTTAASATPTTSAG